MVPSFHPRIQVEKQMARFVSVRGTGLIGMGRESGPRMQSIAVIMAVVVICFVVRNRLVDAEVWLFIIVSFPFLKMFKMFAYLFIRLYDNAISII